MKEITSLIDLCIKNNKQAQEDFYLLLKDRVYGICYRYANSEEEAEDILQESFYSIFKNLKKAKSYDNLYGWIRKIVINKAINHYHKHKKFYENREDEQMITMVSNSSYEEIESQVDTELLLSLIGELPEGYRMVFNLYVVDGYSHKEIAEILGISQSTSKTQLFKAKNQLKSKLKKSNRICYEKTVWRFIRETFS